MGTDITNAILDCLDNDQLLKSINYTYIAFIPKAKSLESMKQVRPISLYSVVCKIISNVLANRLKKVLIQVISDTQSAFGPGHLISDNILVTFESLHYMKTKKKKVEQHI